MRAKNPSYDIPILMLVFNRPDNTKQVLKKVLEIRPQKIYVVADGARATHPDDIQKVAETRKLFDNLPQGTECIHLFRDKNLGCRFSISDGITWFFRQEKMGIILEDDCVPNLSFFNFVRECLVKYEYDERMMHIMGSNFQLGQKRGEIDKDYYFSNMPRVWGWATWRRAWEKYDDNPATYYAYVNNLRRKEIGFKWFYFYKYKQFFERAFSSNNKSVWDFIWHFSIIIHHGLCISPQVNLVSNIGFGNDSTHTLDSTSKVANLPTESINFPLKHPTDFKIDSDADNFSLGLAYGKNWAERIKRKIYLLRSGNLKKWW